MCFNIGKIYEFSLFTTNSSKIGKKCIENGTSFEFITMETAAHITLFGCSFQIDSFLIKIIDEYRNFLSDICDIFKR